MSEFKESVPAGHFYSALPSNKDIQEFYSKDREIEIPGIDYLNPDKQIALLEKLKKFYPPNYPVEKTPGCKYYYNNGLYSYTDAIILQAILRLYEPNLVIEIGSGFSSAVMFEVNKQHLSNDMHLCFIDPHQTRLNVLISRRELTALDNQVIAEKLQDMDLSIFETLHAGDILFIDSTHVSKINSDVNKIFFEILPILRKGVIIHFHDIFWPFMYPQNWVQAGRAWNETYMLRSFLAFNESFEILLFSDYIHKTTDWFKNNMPLCLKVTGGNIWLRKIK